MSTKPSLFMSASGFQFSVSFHGVDGLSSTSDPNASATITTSTMSTIPSPFMRARAKLHSIRVNYHRQRMRLARKLKNPRLEKITFCTLRHWYATNLYHQTKDILYVKNALGHRFVGNTMIYIDLEQAIYANTQDDQFTAKVATNLSEACQLLESGFEYIGNMHGHELFRKRK